MISLDTKNCIVTGGPARCFTGHVRLYTTGPNGVVTVLVGAGFATREASEMLRSDANGCYGDWKPGYGLEVDRDSIAPEGGAE